MGAAICMKPKQIKLNKHELLFALLSKHKSELISESGNAHALKGTTAESGYLNSRLF